MISAAPPNTIRRWLRQADIDAGRREGATTDVKAELLRLRRENALLREERALLHNAVVESFFVPLKVELLHRRDWPTRTAAQLAVFEYIEVWDHRQRLHSTSDYLTPVQFESGVQVGAAA